jgi:hypothetical protein
MGRTSDPSRAGPTSKWRVPFLIASAVVGVVVLGAIAFALRIWHIANLPSPARATLTTSEISTEEARLRGLGLRLPADGLFKERPFEAPWTSHSLLVPSGWLAEPGVKKLVGNRSVRADLLRSDLDILEAVMRRAYGGWDRAEARGWNWSAWFAEWRRRLSARGTDRISIDEAFAPLDALLRFQRDNHTQIPLSRWTSDGSQTALLASAPSAPCTDIRVKEQVTELSRTDLGQQVRHATMWRPGMTHPQSAFYVSAPTSLGTLDGIDCVEQRIRLEPAGKPTHIWTILLAEMRGDRPRVERIGTGVVYARLPTMNPTNYQNLRSSDGTTRSPTDRVLIVDLRDNTGGELTYGLKLLNGWVDPRIERWDTIGTRVTTSCLYPALKWGFDHNFFQVLGDSITADARQSLQWWLDQMAQPFATDCPRAVTVTPPTWKYPDRHFSPSPDALRIIVLVNARCGSDCEALTDFLAALPEVRVVGVNTFGLAQFTQPGYSVLPHTGLGYRLALGTSDLYGDDRSVDGYGLDVDVVLPDVDTLRQDQLIELAHVLGGR